MCVCVSVWQGCVIGSDTCFLTYFLFMHPKSRSLECNKRRRPQWSVRVKQSTAFVLHTKSNGIILSLKYSVSQALLLWSPAISQTAEA